MNNLNHEHYHDPTATEAINNITNREQAIGLLIKGIKLILKAFKLSLIERIAVKDETTGRTYR